MALFKLKKSYFESRVVKYDPRIEEASSGKQKKKHRAGKHRSKGLENVNPNFVMCSKVPLKPLSPQRYSPQPQPGSFAGDDFDLKLLSAFGLEQIDERCTYRIDKAQLKKVV